MQEPNYWYMQSERYERLLEAQIELSNGLMEIIQEQEQVIRSLRLNKTLDKKIAKSECI